MTYHEYLANLSLWLWTEMANHLWQSTLFLLATLLIVVILRGCLNFGNNFEKRESGAITLRLTKN